MYNLNETVNLPDSTTKISLLILLELHTSQGNMIQDTDEEEINHSTVTTQEYFQDSQDFSDNFYLFLSHILQIYTKIIIKHISIFLLAIGSCIFYDALS